MYNIYADGVCIYSNTSLNDNQKLNAPKLTLSDSSAGSLSFTLPQSNVGYDSIIKMVTEITVTKEGIEIWSGRVLNDSYNFMKQREVYCEGELAYLNDSTQPPYNSEELTIKDLFTAIISNHNLHMPAKKQFTVGDVTVTTTGSVVRKTNYDTTIKYINDSLIKQFGGHLNIRKVNEIRYIDYLADYVSTNTQTIEFGKNLLDFNASQDMSGFATVLIPLGKTLDDETIADVDSYVTVASVNNGSVYVQSSDALEHYGWIEQVQTFSDIETPEELLVAARSYLSDIQFDDVTLEVSAVDLHYTDINVEAIKLLDVVRVISKPHGMDKYFGVRSLTIPMNNPEGTTFTLGRNVSGYGSFTSASNKTTSNIFAHMAAMPKKSEFAQIAKNNATTLINNIKNGYITTITSDGGSQELVISDTPDYLQAERIWRWNINGLAYSNNGYAGPYEMAMTMDGEIVADRITSGVLNADILKAGVITDSPGTSYWNLTTGDMHFEAVNTLITELEQSIENTIADNTSYVATPIAINGTTIQNGVSGTAIVCKLFANGLEVDPLKTTLISITPPVDPEYDTLWYSINDTTLSVTLKKYTGSTWSEVTDEVHPYVYNWYRYDSSGQELDLGTIFRTGKIIYVDDTVVLGSTSFLVEVS